MKDERSGRWSVGAGAICGVILLTIGLAFAHARQAATLLRGQGRNGDWKVDAPGVRHRVTPDSMPKPYATSSVDNQPRVVERAESARPKAPAGFRVQEYAAGLSNPRLITVAPNGDAFVAESDPVRIKVLRGVNPEGRAQSVSTYTEGLRKPFGIAFYPPGPNPRYVYVGNTDSVVRFPYKTGDLKASGPDEKIADLPGG